MKGLCPQCLPVTTLAAPRIRKPGQSAKPNQPRGLYLKDQGCQNGAFGKRSFFGHGEIRVYRGTGVSHGVRRTTWDRSLKNWELQIPCFEEFFWRGNTLGLVPASLPYTLGYACTFYAPTSPPPKFCWGDTRHFRHFRRFPGPRSKILCFCGQNAISKFSPISSKPPVFGRGQNDRFPKRPFRQP